MKFISPSVTDRPHAKTNSNMPYAIPSNRMVSMVDRYPQLRSFAAIDPHTTIAAPACPGLAPIYAISPCRAWRYTCRAQRTVLAFNDDGRRHCCLKIAKQRACNDG